MLAALHVDGGDEHFGRCGAGFGEERLITPLPLFHMNALAVSTTAMILSAGCLIQLDRFQPRTWWRGVADSPWIWERLLAQRLFPAREPLSAHVLRLYTKTWTRNLPPLKLRYAG